MTWKLNASLAAAECVNAVVWRACVCIFMSLTAKFLIFIRKKPIKVIVCMF